MAGNRLLAGLVGLLLLGAPAGAGTLQQDFEAAQALLDKGDYAAAETGFSALLARFSPAATSRSVQLVRARLGAARLGVGDALGAEAVLRAAAAGFNAGTMDDKAERYGVLVNLAQALEDQGVLAEAATAYREALAVHASIPDAPPAHGTKATLARTLMWADPAAARTLLDELLALPAESWAKERDTLALITMLRGRVELNNGNPGLARTYAGKASGLVGGSETLQVSISDIVIRGDLLIAAKLLKQDDDMAKYIAYSGAGALLDLGLGGALDRPLPACQPQGDLAPDAMAIIEFGITDNGRVLHPRPIYATRGSGPSTGPGPEELFTAAVGRWSWSPATAQKVKPFWRRAVRVEVRCFTSGGAIDLASQSLNRSLASWIEAQALRDVAMPDATAAAALPVLKAELARREAADGATSAQLLPVLLPLTWNAIISPEERQAFGARTLALLEQHGAPPDARILLQVQLARWTRYDSVEPLLARLLQQREAAGNGNDRLADFLRLKLAQERRGKAAAELVDRVIAGPLPADDPIRIAALLRRSDLATAARNLDMAAAALAATGLSPEQCALVDVRPDKLRGGVSTSDFPALAQRWGTGGIIVVGYDIAKAGQPVNVRTIVAVPPFAFDEATEAAVRRWRYSPVLRPGNEVGCSGYQQLVNFKLAG
jgi:tetratricopeptide (TPR) repeat protein